MRRFSNTARLTTLLSLIAFIGGCTSSDAARNSRNKINTLNIFSSEIEIAGSDNVTGVFSFSPSTQKTVERARHKLGDDMSFEMDTDRDKQGYEFLAYVAENLSGQDTVYVFDYDKNSAKTYSLWSYPGEICTISPALKGIQSVYNGSDRSEAKLVNQKKILASVPATTANSCADEGRLSIEISFEDGFGTGDIERSQSSFAVRETLIDYVFSRPFTTSDGRRVSRRGRYAELGDNSKGTIALEDDSGANLWTANTPESDTQVFATQFSNSEVLLQTDTDLYVASVADMFGVDDLDSEDIPADISGRIFESSRHSLSVTAPGSRLPLKSNGEELLVLDDNQLLLFDGGTDFESIYTIPGGVESIDFYLTESAQILVIQRYATFQTLAVIEEVGAIWEDSTELLNGLTAEQINIDINVDEVFINTFNLGGAGAGWQAHYLETIDSDIKTYDRSVFMLEHVVDSNERTPYLLASTDVDGDNYLIEPSLYIFDRLRPNGRKLARNNRGKIILDDDDQAVAVTYGQMSTTVKQVGSLITVNEIYSYFKVDTAADEVEDFFVNLSTEKSTSLRKMRSSGDD